MCHGGMCHSLQLRQVTITPPNQMHGYSQSPSMSHPVERQMSVPLPVGGHQNMTIVASKWGCSSDLWDLVDRNPRAKFPDLIWVGSSRRLLLGHVLLRTPHLTVVECAACLYRQRLVVTALFPFADTILPAFSPPCTDVSALSWLPFLASVVNSVLLSCPCLRSPTCPPPAPPFFRLFQYSLCALPHLPPLAYVVASPSVPPSTSGGWRTPIESPARGALLRQAKSTI